jgi:hypothetical protein
MTSLYQQFVPQTPGRAEDQAVLQGKLVKQSGKDWVSIDGNSALWGPVFGAVDIAHGTEVVVAIDQNNKPYIVYPSTGGGSGGPAGAGGVSYSQQIGDGVSRTFTVTHNIGTRNVGVAVFSSADPYDEVIAEVERTSINTVTVRTITTPGPNQYTVAVSGPGSAGAAADLTYVHNQGSPAAVWSVPHNLGKYPAVDVVDTGGTQVIPTVLYNDINNVTITFGSATSGKAYLN